ncbi:MAG: helix-turn-helix domain-containing protein [Candidatus Sericytochromatia bacterium]|nr:helix-turn-helix domain-containing protein [Candidatus Sericytochromatia bacterium]
MTTVAQVLRQTRETMGLTLDDVANRTYIKLPYLEALEQDNIDTILAPVFVQGYIRQVARLLGLDGKDLVRRYQLEERMVKPVTAPVPEPVLVAAGRHEAVVSAADAGSAGPIPDLVSRGFNPESPVLLTVAQGDAGVPPTRSGRSNGSAPLVHGGEVAGDSHVGRTSDSGSSARPAGARASISESSSRLPAGEAPEVTAARLEAQRILDEARHEATNLRRAAESYVQQVLAELEADLRASLGTIRGGRQFLAQKRRRPEA